MWHVFQNIIQMADQLKHREWKGSEFCVVCKGKEDV
jgi:hypothetical protein